VERGNKGVEEMETPGACFISMTMAREGYDVVLATLSLQARFLYLCLQAPMPALKKYVTRFVGND
jgi:hypothetical protein